MEGDVFAAMWRGTRDSMVRLGSEHFEGSIAYATDGAYQVGVSVVVDGPVLAYVWQGSEKSARNITPPGARNAGVWDVHDGRAVGGASYSVRSGHAIFWDLRSDEYSDLHPSGFDVSALTGIYGSEQVGFVLDPVTQY